MRAGIRNVFFREFPGSLVVGIWCFQCGGPGLIPGQGTILHAMQGGQNTKTNKLIQIKRKQEKKKKLRKIQFKKA